MSVEFRIAKVAATNVLLWVIAWTPYNTICFIGAFGNRMSITPTISQVGAFFAKLASAMNPVVTAISHPQYRQELSYFLGFTPRPRQKPREEGTNLNDMS